MVNNCAACTKSIRSTQNIKCTKCEHCFHLMCVNLPDIRKLSEDVKLSWTCPLCQSKEPKRNNSNTPIRATVSTCERLRTDIAPHDGHKIFTESNSQSSCMSTTTDPLIAIVAELKLLREEFGDMKSQISEIKDQITSRFNDFEKKQCMLEERIAKQDAEITNIKGSIFQLSDQLNHRAQENLKNEVEIAGLTETAAENPMHLLRVIGQKIGINIEDNDVDFVTRVGPRRPHSGNEDVSSKLPRTMVVRFVRRWKKDSFLKAAKSRRNLVSSDLGLDGPSRRLYFNERLTLENRHLFRTARQRSKEAGFKYCWSKNSVLYVRKQEGHPAMAIKTSSDLEQHLGTPTARKLQLIPTQRSLEATTLVPL